MDNQRRDMRNPNAIITGRLDLADYDDLFGGKCSLSDLDAVIERHGHILIVEMKKPDESMTTGQRILAEALASKKDMTVIIRWGVRGDTERIQVVNYHDAPINCSEACFRAILKHWWEKANARKPFKPSDYFKPRKRIVRIPLPKRKKSVQ